MPYLYYLDYIEEASNLGSLSTCVASCPNVTSIASLSNLYCAPYVTSLPTTDIQLAELLALNGKECALYVVASTPIMNRCIPISPVNPSLLLNNSVTIQNVTVNPAELISTGKKLFDNVTADLINARLFIFSGCGVSLVLCLFLLLCLNHFTSFMVWFILIFVNLAGIYLSYFLYTFWQNTNTAFGLLLLSEQTDFEIWKLRGTMAAFIACTVVTVILILMTIFLRKRISISIQIIKESAKSLSYMPLLS